MSKAVDQAILKTTYLLSSLSGVEKEDNKKVFRKIASSFSWFTPGDSETDQFVMEIVNTVKELTTLRELYDEKDYYSAFMAKLKPLCDTIKADSNATVRKAFVVWIVICLADKELSDDELKTLYALQNYLNGGDFNAAIASVVTVGTGALLTSLISPPMGLFLASSAAAIPYLLMRKKRKPSETTEVVARPPAGKDAIISDSFIKEVIENLKMQDEIVTQLENSTDATQQHSLKKSLEILQNELNSLISNN